jgi:hypothetical protein
VQASSSLITGHAGGSWLIGADKPAAVIRVEATTWMSALAGRDHNPPLELLAGGHAALTPMREARILF